MNFTSEAHDVFSLADKLRVASIWHSDILESAQDRKDEAASVVRQAAKEIIDELIKECENLQNKLAN